ncbi:DNA repair protein complementing XP-C cells homolog [Lingula anatina]|uniref:DNA repair protein complementing XP-C cells homolog n=1 Tax=Lingula anatina TaxID=7574 RepID=A0A1S3K8W9_LINAN|nr:DNA repair protein complementing XP-C cells homolog [Lingula anatina]|eukprot:XP_013419068.1 DNA repair protein complementing XP-C cells homolog [Lingula anatina]
MKRGRKQQELANGSQRGHNEKQTTKVVNSQPERVKRRRVDKVTDEGDKFPQGNPKTKQNKGGRKSKSQNQKQQSDSNMSDNKLNKVCTSSTTLDTETSKYFLSGDEAGAPESPTSPPGGKINKTTPHRMDSPDVGFEQRKEKWASISTIGKVSAAVERSESTVKVLKRTRSDLTSLTSHGIPKKEKLVSSKSDTFTLVEKLARKPRAGRVSRGPSSTSSSQPYAPICELLSEKLNQEAQLIKSERSNYGGSDLTTDVCNDVPKKTKLVSSKSDSAILRTKKVGKSGGKPRKVTVSRVLASSSTSQPYPPICELLSEKLNQEARLIKAAAKRSDKSVSSDELKSQILKDTGMPVVKLKKMSEKLKAKNQKKKSPSVEGKERMKVESSESHVKRKKTDSNDKIKRSKAEESDSSKLNKTRSTNLKEAHKTNITSTKKKKTSDKKIQKMSAAKQSKKQKGEEEDNSDGFEDVDDSVSGHDTNYSVDVTPLDLLLQHETDAPALKREDPIVEDSDSDWEEVQDVPGSSKKPEKSQLPSKPIQITVEAPDLLGKKKKKGFDMEGYVRRMLNRRQREIRENMHRVHLLCLLASGLQRSHLCNSPLLHSQALSLIPRGFLTTKPESYDSSSILKLVGWCSDKFQIVPGLDEIDTGLKEDVLVSRFESSSVASEQELVHIVVIVLRTLGLDARLVLSFQPISLKHPGKVSKVTLKETSPEVLSPSSSKSLPNSKTLQNDKKKKTETKQKEEDKKSKNAAKTESKSKSKNLKSDSSGENKLQSSASKSEKCTENSSSDSKESKTSQRLKTKNHQKRKCASKVPVIDLSDPSSDEEWEEVVTPSGKFGNKDNSKSGIKSKKRAMRKNSEKSGSDSDFDVEVIKFRSPERSGRGGKKTKQSNKKVVSSDSDDSVKITKTMVKEQGSDQWVEVYLESDGQWICIDCVNKRLPKPHELERNATQPISYILGFENDGSMRDLTQKYVSKFSSHTRKLRTDQEWWTETLGPYRSTNLHREMRENEHLQMQQLKQPFPTSITEFKNHPLYALKRHLLKFEAIYPDTAVPLGYIKGEPIYARQCVHTLCSRQTWLKEALVVRVGEEPYKKVKARMTKNRARTNNEEPLLEVFGRWQCEDYIPPPAVDGKVPRNEYGNVELFKPSMLPAGTVHLQIPGLNRVAKKLDIDCAAAMTGWDFHSGWACPVLDGWIVCEEHKDILLAAWDEDQEEQERREAEKREKRVLTNWKTLVKGLLIKERLKRKYNLQAAPDLEDDPSCSQSTGETSGGEKAMDAALSWPRNRMEENNTALDQSHLFPSEKL